MVNGRVRFVALAATVTTAACFADLAGFASGNPDGEMALPDAPSASDSEGSDALAVDAGEGGADAHDAAPHPPRVWVHLAPGTSPPPRHSARAVFDEVRSAVVLYGGGDANRRSLGDLWTWNGTTWDGDGGVANGTSPGPARGFAFTYDAVRRVDFFYRGEFGGGWELGAFSWQQRSGSPAPDAGPQASQATVAAYDRARGVTVLFGGRYAGTVSDETWEWNGLGWAKRELPAKPGPRYGAVMAYDEARSKTVLFGGIDVTNDVKDETWEYDGMTWRLRAPLHRPGRRRNACMAYDRARGVIVVVGGAPALADTWEWDGTDWHEAPPGPPGRRSCALAYDAVHDALVLFGGTHDDPDFGPDAGRPVYGDTWLYR